LAEDKPLLRKKLYERALQEFKDDEYLEGKNR
jgi:hypothetical protein